MGSATAGTKGFLFCDLRGYAAFVEHAGDRAAAELLEAYRTLVRSVIAAHDGAEIRTEGDSVYVVFPTASAAVEAGLAIVAGAAEKGTKERPIRVGVGIHAGETIETDEGLVGGAVNIAARVCAKAQAGEVLVTDTVRALTRTLLPYRFVGLGAQSLKGIAGGIHLYRVEAVPASRAAHLRRRLSAHRRLAAGVVALVGVVLVAGSAAWAVSRPPDCLTLSAATKDVVARIDPARMCVVEVIPVGRQPDSIVATDDAVWVANETDWTVTRIDLATRRPSHTLGMPGAPISLAADPGRQIAVLAYDDRTFLAGKTATVGIPHRVVAISEPDFLVRFTYPDLPDERLLTPAMWVTKSLSGYAAITVSSGWAWVVSPRGTVARLLDRDAVGGPGVTVADFGGIESSRPALIAATGGIVWVVDTDSPAVYRFDSPDIVTGMTLSGSRGTRGAAASATELWLLRQDGSVTRIDASTKEQRNVPLDGPASALTIGPTSLWLLDDTARTIRSADPGSGSTLRRVEVGGVPASAVYAGGALWLTIHAP